MAIKPGKPKNLYGTTGYERLKQTQKDMEAQSRISRQSERTAKGLTPPRLEGRMAEPRMSVKEMEQILRRDEAGEKLKAMMMNRYRMPEGMVPMKPSPKLGKFK